jgi:hypothetical protein
VHIFILEVSLTRCVNVRLNCAANLPHENGGSFMKNRKTLPLYIAAITVALLLASLSVSCASTGNFMPISQGETVIGTVQADFVARNTLKGRDAINTQAYIKLLEAAQERYGRDMAFDIRDIVWVSGQAADNQNTEYSATGKVVKIP